MMTHPSLAALRIPFRAARVRSDIFTYRGHSHLLRVCKMHISRLATSDSSSVDLGSPGAHTHIWHFKQFLHRGSSASGPGLGL